MQQRWFRRIRRLGVASAVVLSVVAAVVVVPVFTDEASAASAKVTICHRTHSTTNPYRKITVSQSAITRNNGHRGHEVTNGNPPVFDSTFVYTSNNKIWGDVIPGGDADGTPFNGAANIALNWTAEGKALFFSAACTGLTAKQFYDVEIAAGVPEADVLADLNSQSANEDAALLAALGGSFTADNVTQWDTAVSVTTSAATSVAGTTATVNGALTVGTTSTATGFDYGTSPTLETFTSLAATPTTVTGSDQAVTASLTGLTSGVTYYFRATGTTNAGTDTEGILTGAILSFTTTGATTQAITFDQPTAMTLGGGTQTLTVATAAPSDLPVTFTSNSTSVCTVAGAVVTAVDVGTCSITATQGGDATHAPATPVTRTFVVDAMARTLTIDAGSYDAAGYPTTATPPTITSAPSAGTGTTTYSSTTTGVCTIDPSSGAVTFVTAGTCTIGAVITAAGGYASATATPVSFAVTAPAPTTTTTTTTPAPTTTTTPPPTITVPAPAPTPAPTTTTSPTTAPTRPRPTTTTPPTTTPPTTAPTTAPLPSDDVSPSDVSPPADVSPTATGSIRGVAWFDRNHNGVFDGREWILPGVTVTLTPGRTAAATTTADEAFTASAAPETATVVTGPDGSYRFAGLAPGDYQVAGATQIKGFDYTSDSDGDADWVVAVGVEVDDIGVADFAGLGRGELFGKMFELRTDKGLGFAAVTCRWGGYDDVLGTADDVPFQVTAASDGTFDMRGIPYGEFTCTGTDEAGRTSAAVAASVLSPEPVEAPLPVDTPPTGGLPVTGSPTTWVLLIALLCIATGSGLLVVGRQRERLLGRA